MKNAIYLIIVVAFLNSCSGGNTFTDKRDNKVYKTIKIGDNIWMAENLNYDMDSEGSYHYPDRMLNIESDKLDEAIDFHQIDKNSLAGLKGIELLKIFTPYLDSAVKKYPEGWRYYTYNAAKRACPEGWRLPTDDDWDELNEHLKEGIYNDFFAGGVAWWKKDYNNPILEIRLGDYFGAAVYWSTTIDPAKFSVVHLEDGRFKCSRESKSGDISSIAFCIRCIKDDSQ